MQAQVSVASGGTCMGLGQGASCAACGAEDTQRATFPGGPLREPRVQPVEQRTLRGPPFLVAPRSLDGPSSRPERRWHFCTQSQLRCCWETEPDDWTSGILSSRL